MLAGGHDHAAPGAGIHVDMREHAALADELELGQPVEQRRADLRALAYQHQRFGILQPLAQSVHVLYVIIPDLDVVACQFAETAKRAQSVVIVVEYRDLHEHLLVACG